VRSFAKLACEFDNPSTQDSGLFGYLLPMVKQRLGIEVMVLAQGTGQALCSVRPGCMSKRRRVKCLPDESPVWKTMVH
jgi:hypothetical protein